MDILEKVVKNSKQSYVENVSLLARKLRELREKLGWTQQYLAEETRRKGIPPLSLRQIRRAENCEKGVSIGCYHRIAQALGTTLDGILESETAELKWNVPYPRNPFFTGREEVLAQLRDVLAAGKAVLTQPQAISGLGGIGKTQTAVEYAYRYRNDYKAVLWIKSDSQEYLISSFVDIASLLNLPEQNVQNQKIVVVAVKGWLEINADWLLIFDNADEPQILKEFIPSNPKGHILLTSRASDFQSLGIIQPVRLDKMTPTEAKGFLLKRTGRAQHAKPLQPTENEAVEQLAAELDYLPLALEQATAYITQLDSNFQNYLSSFQKRGFKLLDKTGAVIVEYPFSVTTTWALNFEQVEQKSHIAADLLRVSAFLHPDQIPIELLTLGAEEINSELSSLIANVDDDPLILDEALAPLTRYSLIRRDPTTQTYSIHRLVQAVLKERLSQTEQSQWAERAVRAVNAAFPEVDFPNWHLCERLLPHAQICAEHIEKWKFEFEEAAQLLNQLGQYLHDRFRLNEAEPFLKRALAIREKSQGLHYPDIAQSLYNLGRFYHTQEKLDEAETLLKQALVIRKKIFGLDHPATALSFNILAQLYEAQGKYAEAEQFYQRMIEIIEKSTTPEYSYLVGGLKNYADLLRRIGRHAEAERLESRAKKIDEAMRR